MTTDDLNKVRSEGVEEGYAEGKVDGYDEGFDAGVKTVEGRIMELEARIEVLKTRLVQYGYRGE